MSDNQEWPGKYEGWQFYDTVQKAMEAAQKAAEGAPFETLPTVFQVTTIAGIQAAEKEQYTFYTFGLTGWEVFKATIADWPIVCLWYFDGWRESFLTPPITKF